MKVLCIKNYYGFQKNHYYNIINTHSIFEKNDFITIQSDESLEHSWYRFRLNKSNEYIDEYLGQHEIYFYDYFINVKEERKKKLKNISE